MTDLLQQVRSLMEANQYAAAEPLLHTFLRDDPTHAGAWCQLSAVLTRTRRYAEGEWAARRSVACDPLYPDAIMHVGMALLGQRRYAESIPYFDRSLELAPDMPLARWNRWRPRLHVGDWPGGFEDYQWGDIAGTRIVRFREKEWAGEDIKGKTLYVWSEQGIGDRLMMMQVLRLVKERFEPAQILLEMPADLLDLVWGFPYADEVLFTPPQRHKPRPFDAHCSLMSLPHAIGLTPQMLPAMTNYLHAEGTVKKNRIGYCWYGGTIYGDDCDRSLPQELYMRLRFNAGIDAVSLHADGILKNHGLTTWRQTAELIATCSRVITVDTAVAHVAGAMGVPVTLLTNYYPDWRWAFGPIWYPHVEIIAQPAPCDWEHLFEEIKEIEVSQHEVRRHHVLHQGLSGIGRPDAANHAALLPLEPLRLLPVSDGDALGLAQAPTGNGATPHP